MFFLVKLEVNKSCNLYVVCHMSSQSWHNMLGHSDDKVVLHVLRLKLNTYNNDHNKLMTNNFFFFTILRFYLGCFSSGVFNFRTLLASFSLS